MRICKRTRSTREHVLQENTFHKRTHSIREHGPRWAHKNMRERDRERERERDTNTQRHTKSMSLSLLMGICSITYIYIHIHIFVFLFTFFLFFVHTFVCSQLASSLISVYHIIIRAMSHHHAYTYICLPLINAHDVGVRVILPFSCFHVLVVLHSIHDVERSFLNVVKGESSFQPQCLHNGDSCLSLSAPRGRNSLVASPRTMMALSKNFQQRLCAWTTLCLCAWQPALWI